MTRKELEREIWWTDFFMKVCLFIVIVGNLGFVLVIMKNLLEING